MRKKPITAAASDSGLEQIERWHTWFVGGHTRRLADAGLSPDELAQNLAIVHASAAAIVERMRSDYLARRQQ